MSSGGRTPGRRRGWLFALTAAALAALLTAALMQAGLDQADKIASVIGAVVGLIGLLFVLFPGLARPSPAEPAASQPPPDHPFPPQTYAPAYPVAPARRSNPGRVIGIVLLCVAVFACSCFAGVSWLTKELTQQQAKVEAARSASSPPPGRSGAAKPATRSTAPVVFYQNEIRLDSTPRDFDQKPPYRSWNSGYDGTLWGSRYDYAKGVAYWTGRKTPTRDECTTRVATHGANQVEVVKGTRFCLITGQGRTVYVSVKSGANGDFLVAVTVWEAD